MDFTPSQDTASVVDFSNTLDSVDIFTTLYSEAVLHFVKCIIIYVFSSQ